MQIHSTFLEENRSKTNDFACNQCDSGRMKKLRYPQSFDFNKDGYIPRVCDHCGTCSDIERIIKDLGTLNAPLSKKYIDRVLDRIFVGKKLDFKIKKSISKKFSNKKFYSLYNLAYLIHREMTDNGFIIEMEFILKVIYQKYKPLHAYA
jgi:hypothetical protein